MTSRQIREQIGLPNEVSLDTIKRTLRKNNLFGRISARKPNLSTIQMRKRRDWCRIHSSWSNETWSKVIFSDECPLYLNSKSRCYVRRSVGQRLVHKYLHRTQKFSPFVMAWGAIRNDGRRILIRCIGNVDSVEYQRILRRAKAQIYSTRYIFQHDGAPAHRSASTGNFLRNEGILVLSNWPAQSPDLNIIDNLWATLKRELYKIKCKNLDELFAAAEDIWNNIPLSSVQELYNSLPRRMNAVVLKKGGSTKY